MGRALCAVWVLRGGDSATGVGWVKETAWTTKRDSRQGSGSRLACLTMVFKLAMAAQKTWRALNGGQLIADVIDGVPFVDVNLRRPIASPREGHVRAGTPVRASR